MTFIISSSYLFAQKNTEEIKKEAEKAFEEENYAVSYKLYSQLVANFTKEPIYNYRLGVSMIFAEANKKACLPYLEFAKKYLEKKEVPAEVLFYFGKANHLNYKFDEAIKFYKEYKQKASSSKIKELEVDREIAACENGKKLLSDMKELVVISKKQLNINEYFRSYDLSSIGGKLLKKPDEFISKIDKKKKDNSIIYLPKSGDKIYYASYGDDGKNGKDIYFALKLPNGGFGKPQPLSAINTPYDEDYPFLHPNGKVLYFASKGHKGMGGYDIFKSTFDEASQSWTTPINLEFPINSPGDDFLFVTDSSEKFAFFSTSRYAPIDKIDVLKIKTEKVAPLLVAIKGNVKKNEVTQSVASVITVKNIVTGNIEGKFTADETGKYYIQISNGGKFLFTVETPGFTTQSESVNVPLCYSVKPLKQDISYEKNILKITNYFDAMPNDENYLDIIELIEQKSQLDVNENLFKQQKDTTTNNVVTNQNTQQNNTTIEKHDISASNTPIPPDNTQELTDIVKKDADEAQQEANQIKVELNKIQEVIKFKNDELNKINQNINNTQQQINSAEGEEKQQLTQLLNDLNQKKENTQTQLKTFEEYNKNLEQEYQSKQKEADLNNQFIQALTELDKGKNKNTAIKKLEELQKELQQIEKQKSSYKETLLSLDNQQQGKQEELNKLEKQKSAIESDMAIIKQEIDNNKQEFEKTKDKTLKDNLQVQITNQQNEYAIKQKELNATNEKIEDTKDDIASINEEKELIGKIKNNQAVNLVSVNNNTINNNNNNTTNPANNIINANNINTINQQYKGKIEGTTDNNEKTKLLNEYNKQIVASIEENKNKINNTTAQKEKQKLINLNNELEHLLSNNNDQLKQLQNQVTTNQTNNNQNVTENNIQNNNITNNTQTDGGLNLSVKDQQELLNKLNKNNQLIAQTESLQKQFKDQVYQSKEADQYKNNIKPITTEENSFADIKNIVSIISNKKQSEYLNTQADSIRKISSEYKQKSQAQPNQKETLLSQAKKLDIAATEKEYQATQFLKTSNESEFKIYEKNIQDFVQKLPESQQAAIQKELNQSQQLFKQAKQIRAESATQSNLTVKLATEQNALEKEQIALNTLNKIIKDNNIKISMQDVAQNVDKQTETLKQNHLETYKNFSSANLKEIEFITQQLDTSSKVKNDANLLNSYNQLKDLIKTIQANNTTIMQQSTTSEAVLEQYQTLVNNEISAIQQLRQITNSTQPIVQSTNDKTLGNDIEKNISKNVVSSDTINTVAQKLPVNFLNNSSAKTIQILNQEQNQILNNINTPTSVLKSKEEIIQTNKVIESEISKLTQEAFKLKQQIAQTTEPITKAELQTQFDRVNTKLQEKKVQQTTNEILMNQTEYQSNQEFLDKLVSQIPKNNISEINAAQNTINEIKKLKSQEESFLKEAIGNNNMSAQLGILQNAKIKQQEYAQAQEALIDKLKVYNTTATKKEMPINVNDPLALTFQYKANMNKQIKEWENLNNSLNIEITKVYPKYSATPAGKMLESAQKLVAESKTETNQQKKLELLVKAVQMQEKAMQTLSTSIVTTNNNDNINNTHNNNVVVNTNKNKVNNNATNENKNNIVNNNTTNTTTIDNNKNKTNTNVINTENNNFVPSITGIKTNKAPIYSAGNPIPLNPKLAEGLVFSVQVGAFKNPLPNNFFNGLNPIFSQTADNNLYRYLVGQMQNPQEAIALKNNFQKLGYNDAFVIAYYNGKRISFSEALEIMKKNGQQNVSINPFATTNILEKAKIPTYTTLMATTQQNNTPVSTVKEAEEINDLYYTVQIGVYGKEVTDNDLKYLKPVVRSKVNDKYYRYSAGIYDNLQKAIADKEKVVAMGIKDAFVAAYWNGKRLFYQEALKIVNENKNIRYASPQPIIFPNAISPIATINSFTTNNANIETTNQANTFDPTLVVSNNVNKRPEPTPDNGVKQDNTGVCFRVQIGAFKNKVPPIIAEKYFKIKDWPLEVSYINGLYIYTVGNYIAPNFATKLREEIVALGIKDAFITVFKDNKKLYGYDALKYFNQK